jgi:hypothetical protein
MCSKSSREKRKAEVNIQKNMNKLQEGDNTERDKEVKIGTKERDGGKYKENKRAVRVEKKYKEK